MVIGLLTIVFCFISAVFFVQTVYKLNPYHTKRTVHYILMTRNNESQIEWYIRYFTIISWISGRPVGLTVLDEGSTDNTISILERLGGPYLEIIPQSQSISVDTLMKQYQHESIIIISNQDLQHMRNISLP